MTKFQKRFTDSYKKVKSKKAKKACFAQCLNSLTKEEALEIMTDFKKEQNSTNLTEVTRFNEDELCSFEDIEIDKTNNVKKYMNEFNKGLFVSFCEYNKMVTDCVLLKDDNGYLMITQEFWDMSQ